MTDENTVPQELSTNDTKQLIATAHLQMKDCIKQIISSSTDKSINSSTKINKIEDVLQGQHVLNFLSELSKKYMHMSGKDENTKINYFIV